MYSEFFPWNSSDIFLDFFLRNFSYGTKIKFLRKDFDPSYLRIGTFVILKLDAARKSLEKLFKTNKFSEEFLTDLLTNYSN
jgi:hypothetical protein